MLLIYLVVGLVLLVMIMNDKIYHNLIQRINLILDGRGFSSEEYSFRKQLSLGRYSHWAESITAEQLISILCTAYMEEIVQI